MDEKRVSIYVKEIVKRLGEMFDKYEASSPLRQEKIEKRLYKVLHDLGNLQRLINKI